MTIEVVCPDMMCFKVDPVTLDALCCSYYEPAAWADPRGPQMSFAEWTTIRANARHPSTTAMERK